MKKAIYPGSFDPVTLGHLDIIKRSAALVDHLIVGVLNNSTKTPLFSVDERVNMLKEVTKDIPNVEILSMSQTNRVAAPDIDTIFLNTSLKYAYLSSSIVKEMAMYGGDISKFVPESIVDIVRERYSSSYNIKANEKGDIK